MPTAAIMNWPLRRCGERTKPGSTSSLHDASRSSSGRNPCNGNRTISKSSSSFPDLMAARIEDYAIIGDCRTAALVSRDGSIDWFCCPRFDSEACFAALLGSREHGRWSIAPCAEARVARRYRPNTLVLETHFETEDGAATLIDFMPPGGRHSTIMRLVVGTRGKVA